MNKKTSLLLSFMLLSSALSPMAFAEVERTDEAAAEAAEVETTEGEATAEEVAARPSDPFTDLADLSDDEKHMLDALIEDGIFNGVSENTFGIDLEMNRAQFAKVAALIFGLEVDETLTVSSFTDVSADDPANGYALPYIEALKAAGLTNGINPEGTLYNPSGTVSREELAAFLIRGLGLEEEAADVEPVADETVSEWAGGYVALALDKGFMSNLEVGTFGGTTAASRYTLAVSAYQSTVADVPAQLSIVSVKQVGAKKAEVKFNKEVDSMAEIELRSKGKSVESIGEWNDKYDSVVLEMTKEGETFKQDQYSVHIKGLEEDAVDVGSMEFIGEFEKIKSIDVVSHSETLPSSKVTLEIRGINQYGEKAAVRGGDLLVTVGAQNRSYQLDAKRQWLTIDLTNERRDTRIPVTILDQRNYVTVSKTFIVGDPVMVSKVEIGDLKFDGSQTRWIAGTTAYLAVNAYDQYGNQIIDESVLTGATGLKAYAVSSSAEPVLVDSNNKDKAFDGQLVFNDIDDDGKPEIILEAYKHLKSDEEITLHVFGAATDGALTKTITAYSQKAPVRVEFRDWPDLRPFSHNAANPSPSFIELKMFDSTGYELSKEEILEAETDGKFRVYSMGPIVLESDKPARTGSDGKTRSDLKIYEKNSGDRGKITIKEITGIGPASVFVQLGGNMQAPIELKLNITEKGKIAGIRVKDSKTSYDIMPGQDTGPTFEIFDNYGGVMNGNEAGYYVDVKLEQISVNKTSHAKTTKDGIVYLYDPSDSLQSTIVTSNSSDYELNESTLRYDVDSNGSSAERFRVNGEQRLPLFPLMVYANSASNGAKVRIGPVSPKDAETSNFPEIEYYDNSKKDETIRVPFAAWARLPIDQFSAKGWRTASSKVSGMYGNYRMTATLIEADSTDPGAYGSNIKRVLGSASVNLNLVDKSKEAITYSIDFPDKLPAYGKVLREHGKVPSTYDVTYMYYNGRFLYDYNADNSGENRISYLDPNGDGITTVLEINSNGSFYKWLEIRAKNAAGVDVSLDKYWFDMVKDVYSSDPRKLDFVTLSTGGGGYRGYPMEPGKVTIYAVVQGLDGKIQTVSKEVEIVEEPLKIDKVAKFPGDQTISASNLMRDNVWIFDSSLLTTDIEIRDQYNISIDEMIAGYDDIYPISFFVNDVKYKAGTAASDRNQVYIEKNKVGYTKAKGNYSWDILTKDADGKDIILQHGGNIDPANIDHSDETKRFYEYEIKVFSVKYENDNLVKDQEIENHPQTQAIAKYPISEEKYHEMIGTIVKYNGTIQNTGDKVNEVTGADSRYDSNYRLRVLDANGQPLTSKDQVNIEEFNIYISYPNGLKNQRITVTN